MRTIQGPRVVSREDWLDARTGLQVKEKELTRLRDQLAAERRALPWVRVEKTYVFDGPQGRVTLADLFDGRSQLFVKHSMMRPGQAGQCVGCSLEVDHIGPLLVHLQNHDVSYAAVARAPIEEIAAGRAFYNYEYVNPGLEDRSGDSVFYRDGAGQIFHTHSTFGRGGEDGPYNTLADWVRPGNMYGQGGMVEVTGRYHRPDCACAVHESADRKEPS